MAETIAVADPSEELRERVDQAIAVGDSYSVITSPEQRGALGEDVKTTHALLGTIETERLKIAAPLTQASRAVNELFRKMSDPVAARLQKMKRAAVAWDDEQDRIKARAVREAAAKADAERAAIQQQAAYAEAKGDQQTAHALESAAALVAPVPVQLQETPKVAGEGHRNIWRAECVDPIATMRAIADGSVKLSDDDLQYLRIQFDRIFSPRANALKDAFALPGVKAIRDRILTTRAA